MEKVTVATGVPYEVLIGEGLLKRAGELAAQAVKGRRVMILTDDTVGPLYLEKTMEAFRAAGEKAGLHFFSDATDLRVWSSPEFLSVHTREGGVKEIRLKRSVRRITEIFSGEVKGENCASFRDEFAAPDTRLYYLED